MKIKSTIVFCVIAIAQVFSSCSEDFLDRPSLSEIGADNFYKSTEELRLATAALYAGTPWADWTYTSYLPVGEVLSGNMLVGYWGDAVQLNSLTVTGMNGIMIANWKGMYKVIIHCNLTIAAIQKSPSSIPQADKDAAIAEAKFIRGYAYYNLALLWGDVPIIEDNISLINSPLVPKHQVQDVYRFIVNDLTFASQHLPEADIKGRLTTWSAQGLLSKVYLTWAGLNSPGVGLRNQTMLDSAKVYAGRVCNQSGLQLFPNYADQFKAQNNDNSESLFALQWTPGLGWLEGNMLQIYSTGGVEIAPNGTAGWFGITPTVDLYELYTPEDSIRRKATIMLKGDYYPELNAKGGGFTYKGDAGLKKHIIGTRDDNQAPTMNLTSSVEHNSLLRLADIYLIYAEAILGNNASTADNEALLYFNKVRIRAGLDPVTILTPEVIFNERRIELAAEGHHWNDIVRLSYYDTPGAIKLLNDSRSKRVHFTYEDGVITPQNPYAEVTPADENTFKFPIPSSEITANPKLGEAPVPYF